MSPIVIPTIGPPIIEPIITGICIMVALAPGSGINPYPVKPSTTQTADNIPIVVS